ncbi:MAG: deoxyguanosinetriphosphate triphosphohydrolase, partial [Kiloniellales bacterium]|nr:deoxyguanosinetriphosphate triphosphohydrolase [Kiloniellales bacterium]
LFTPADLAEVPLVGPSLQTVRDELGPLEPGRLSHECVRRVINAMVNDLLAETRSRLAEAAPQSAEAIRALDHPVVAFSEAMREKNRGLKAFLFERMYRHYRVNRMITKARRVVTELFELYLSEPRCLPSEWRAGAGTPGSAETARLVADYIAGMTDRYALDEHRRLFDAYARS